jgi:hypothetical protein
MGFDVVTTPSIDDATKQNDYTRHRDALRALASAMGGVVLWQGGDLEEFQLDTTEVTLRKAGGDPGFEIDGQYLGYVTVILEAVAIRDPSPGTNVTCTVDLYNVTDSAAVASSAVAITLNSAAAVHQKSVALTLPASVKRYRVRIKTSSGTQGVAAIARVVAKGS